jgi:disulfide bond formation protein DsbB
MEQMIDTLMSNPLYIGIAVIIAVIIVFGFIKRLFKLVGLIIVIAVGYGIYLYMTDPAPAETLKRQAREVTEKGKQAWEDTEGLRQEAGEQVKKTVEKAKEELEKQK